MMTVSSSRSLPAPPLAMAGVLMLLLLFVFCQPVSAWEQDTHMGINLEAIKRFQTIYGTQASFQDSPLLQEALYRGIEVPDSAKLDRNHRMEEADKTYAGWIVHGGYAADEPNLYASVRHFYDPLAISGNAWLTDQISLHGTWNYATGLSIPEIDAKSWGLRHPDNPYTFARALAYYEKAMSIPEGTEPSGFSGSGLFRSQNQKAGTLEEERKEYLAAAFCA